MADEKGVYDLRKGGDFMYEDLSDLDDNEVLFRHWEETCDLMTKVAQEPHGTGDDFIPPMRIKFDAERAKTGLDFMSSRERAIIRQFVRGERDNRPISGRIHPAQIETAMEVIGSQWVYPELPIQIHGPMQCGKTGTTNLCHFMGPIIYLLTGGKQKVFPLAMFPPKIAHYDQAVAEYRVFKALYGHLRITLLDDPGKVITLNEYTKAVGSKMPKAHNGPPIRDISLNSHGHFAVYPEDLVEPCVAAGCPVGMWVLDPFGGSGTTGAVANRLGRHCDLIELKPEYVEIARARCNSLPV